MAKLKEQIPKNKIDKGKIVLTALEIIETLGEGDFSMRKLGAKLKVDPMALYYHIPNKDALYDEIVDHIYAQIDYSKIDKSADFEQVLLDLARAYKIALMKYPRCLIIMGTRSARTPRALQFIDFIASILIERGIVGEAALNIINTVGAFVIGLCLAFSPQSEESADDYFFKINQFPHLAQSFSQIKNLSHINLDATLEFGLETIFKGTNKL